MPSFKYLFTSYYRKNRGGLLLDPYLLIIYSRKKLHNKSKSFLTQQWITKLCGRSLLSHPMAQALRVSGGSQKPNWALFHTSPVTKTKKPTFALRCCNSSEWMAGMKSRNLSSKCKLVNSSAGDPRHRIFSKSFSHRTPVGDYK